MLHIQNISYGYTDFPLFKSISTKISSGEWLHICGPNGVGKSTLLKIIVGLIRPQMRQIQWQGHGIETDLKGYQHQLVYISHQNGLSEALTLQENLALDWHWHDACEVDLELGLMHFQLDGFLKMTVANLSKGQQRKAALLRLWMTRARLWVLDEPFTALDSASTQVLMDKLKGHLISGGQVVLTSHLPVRLPSRSKVELIL